MSPWFSVRVFPLVVLVVGGVACKDKGDTIRGSCERSQPDGYGIGSVRQCNDAYTKTRAEFCKDKASSKPCAHADAVGGCKSKDGVEIEWYFNGPAPGGFATLESVGKYCVETAKGTTLLPNGAVAPVKGSDERRADDLKKAIDADGAKARTALATVATIAAKLPAPTGKLDLQGLKGDTLVVHREDLGDLENPKKLAYRLEEASTLGACSRILNKRAKPTDKPYDLGYCAKNPLLAIISVSSYAPAVATGTSVSGNTKTTFVKKGSIASDFLFFRMDNGKYLGSFPVSAENTDGNRAPDVLTKELLEQWPTAIFSKAQVAAPSLRLNFKLATP